MIELLSCVNIEILPTKKVQKSSEYKNLQKWIKKLKIQSISWIELKYLLG